MVEIPESIMEYAQKGGQCFSCGKPWVYDDFVGIYYCDECDAILAKLPGARAYMILGDTGTGKTVLVNKILDLYIKNQRPCAYIAFDEHPFQLREFMRKYIRNLENREKDRLIMFFDCYSCTAGVQSEEKYFLKSPGDLNDLNLQLTELINQLSAVGTPIVCIDSLTKAFIHCEGVAVLRFITSLAAKLKAKRGSLLFTVGAGAVSLEVQKRLEQLADGLIELRIVEVEGRSVRQFRISKIRGVIYYENWLPFFVGKSSIFLSVPNDREELKRFNAIFKMIAESQ